jgi:uncharacterized protein (TIGR02466 family)
MNDIRVEFSNTEIVSFTACPIFHSGTNFRLTDDELHILTNESGGTRLSDGPARQGVHISENHTVLNTPGLERVQRFMLQTGQHFVKNTLEIDNEFYLTQTWFTRNDKNSTHHPHTHPNSILAMVYYPQCESGDIVLSVEQNNMFPHFDFNWKINRYNNFNAKSWTFKVQTGDVIMFPGYVTHLTTPNESDTPRYALGANFFTRGTFGTYENTDLLELK